MLDDRNKYLHKECAHYTFSQVLFEPDDFPPNFSFLSKYL